MTDQKPATVGRPLFLRGSVLNLFVRLPTSHSILLSLVAEPLTAVECFLHAGSPTKLQACPESTYATGHINIEAAFASCFEFVCCLSTLPWCLEAVAHVLF